MKNKIFIIIAIAIIIVETIGLIVLGIKYKKLNEENVKQNIQNEVKEEKKSYVGIYHSNNFNKREANIILNEDNTCGFLNYTNEDYYTCNYEEIDKDNIRISVKSYVPKYSMWEEAYENNSYGSTKEKCNEKIKGSKEFVENSCKEKINEYKVTLVNGGLLYSDIQFYKIK